MCSFLNRTGSTYYFRRPVPLDLIGYFRTATGGVRREWKFSLGTRDRETAKCLKRSHEAETDNLIVAARRALLIAEDSSAQPEEPLEPPMINSRQLEEQEASAAVEAAKKARYEARAVLRKAIRQRVMLSTAELSPEEAAWRDLLREREQDVEALKQAAAGQRGLNDRLAVSMGSRPAGSGVRTIEVLIEAYEADKSPRWSGSSRKAVGPVFRVLSDVFAGRDITSITREEARGVVSLLEGLPTQIGKRKELRGLRIFEAVEKGKALGLPTIQPKTINDGYLIHIAAMWNWAVAEQWVVSSPFSSLSVYDPVHDADRRDPFTVEQLQTLFSSARWSSPWEMGGEKPGEYWVPLLCLFQGFRNGEAAGLRVEDVAEDDGLPMLRILPYDGRTLKTNEARGTLPVHPELLRLGFMAHVAQRKGAGETLLFPEGVANNRGQVAAKLGERFSRQVKTLGLVGRKLGMHSFRHCFEDRLRAAELPERTALALARRSEPGSSRSYGDGLSARQKAEAIARISYPGLDLAHLYAAGEAAPA